MRIVEVLKAPRGSITVRYSDGSTQLRTGGSVAWRCQNPGNLKNGKFTKERNSIGQDYGGHAVFPTLEDGNRAHHDLLFSPSTRYYNLTLIDAVSRYAPASDGNNPYDYQRYITKRTGIAANRVLKTLSAEEKQGMLECMRLFEGYKEGEVRILTKGKRSKNDISRTEYSDDEPVLDESDSTRDENDPGTEISESGSVTQTPGTTKDYW